MQVGEEVAVERPAEGEEVQGLAAAPLGSGADGAAGLQDAPPRAALRQEQAARQPPQGLEAGQIHQNLADDSRDPPPPLSAARKLGGIKAGWEKRRYPVLLQESGCFSLVGNGQPDVWEGGEIVAEAATHFHFDGLA